MLKQVMVNYRHLFFDLDRTLWDYELNASQALNEVFETYNLAPVFGRFENLWEKFCLYNDLLWEDYKQGLIQKNDLRNVRFEKALMDYGVSDTALAKQINRDFLQISPLKTNLIDGSIDLLNYLKEKKKYQLYIITNGFNQIQEKKMISSGLQPYFLKMFTSDRSGYAKPQRAMFENAVKSVNAKKKESLMIGDDLNIDIIGARSFGMDQVYFNPSRSIHTETVTYEISSLQEMKDIL